MSKHTRQHDLQPPDLPYEPAAPVIIPVTPSAEKWQALSCAEREQFLDLVITATEAWRLVAGEGRPHANALRMAYDQLGRHFGHIGRRLYLAENMPVLYPGEPVFVPDILAVLDVEDTGEADLRMGWVVADEGRGPDWVLEILHGGNRRKDLVRNVADYARLGIREYFVYDRLHQTLFGYRLPPGTAAPYERLKLRLGRLESQVLGLELAIVEGRLRFFSGLGEILGSPELVRQLGHMVEDLEARAEAEAQRAEAEAQRAEAEAQRAEAEAQRADALREAGLELQRQTILRLLERRGWPVSAGLREALAQQLDPERLAEWTLRAALAASIDEVTLDS